MRQNRKQYDHHYQINDYVMIKKYDPKKGEERLHGPCPILETRTNGTIVVQQQNDGLIKETYNIRKVVPYKGPRIQPTPVENHMNFFMQQMMKWCDKP